MKRKRFPDEAPVFEVLHDASATAPVGAFVVGVEADEHSDYVRATWPFDGGQYVGYPWFYLPEKLKPLTPAARAMLAIAKRGAK